MWKLKMKLQAGGWKCVERNKNQSANRTETSLGQVISSALSGMCQLTSEDKRSDF